jgi:hypothetical protein
MDYHSYSPRVILLCKGGDFGNLDMPKRSNKMLPLIKKVEVLDFIMSISIQEKP